MADAATIARNARSATGLTQREFARLIGANHITVSKWENGARHPSQVALSLLYLLASGPEACMQALGELERKTRKVSRARRRSSRQQPPRRKTT